ncbi:50S ribosomal protein L23 [Spiroplasma sp. TIUS-1]|uniref:50S ribosomal protein L23 n=1 Tax=Spiroplasma sp. TIUS-1 TaxID=216963 RepID=UPI00139766E8|nr:50S ribosomal protein L23 [Spiroplasma sp. TIUS-1]QHX36180.1 50S ribosomal protein L23 [Spiroplasma sp. TIUS-1]
MHLTEVIKKPLLTEKTYASRANNEYAFIVDKKANKVQIKKAFETIFNVKVEEVRTMNYDGKAKRMGKFEGTKASYKKAIIKLKDGEKFEILNDL